jgi:2-polyprenyl-6-hydroxyphenyl methylase/3-demethylubiquinone-9 3-methyltransferase
MQPAQDGVPSVTTAADEAAATSTVSWLNVDPEEVVRYRKLAETWWDEAGPFWPLHRLNALRSDYLERHLVRLFLLDETSPRPLTGLKVLDIGCGGGILSESMARLGASVHGVDVVHKNILIAEEHARQQCLDIYYEFGDIENLLRRTGRYDVILNMEVIEHVPDYGRLLRQSAALLKPEGVMVVATINRTALSWLFAIVGAEYILRWLPRGTHQWRRFVKPAEVRTELESCKMKIEDSTGVNVNPVTRRFSLVKRMAVNYMMLARR